MYLWCKLAEPHWLSAYENILQARSGGRLAIISRPWRKRLQLEIACASLDNSRKLVEELGGCTEKWPCDWLKLFADREKRNPLKIGRRLLIASSSARLAGCCNVRCPQRIDRPIFASDDSGAGTDAEVRAAFEGHTSYFGTYTIDPSARTVTHHVRGASYPNWMGHDQIRYYRIDGSRLVLSSPPILFR